MRGNKVKRREEKRQITDRRETDTKLRKAKTRGVEMTLKLI